jgi:LCP family protein required for cell wall assembly
MGSSIPPEESGRGVASAEPPSGQSSSPAPGEAAPPAEASPPDQPPPDDEPPLSPPRPRRRRRKILIWTASITAGVVALAAVGVFLVYRHLNGNIQQRDVSGLLGTQPVDLHPQAENILVVGSDSRFGQGKGYGTGLVTDQSDTTMIVHIAASRQWAEVMSIPRDSYVAIPSCKEGNGQMSPPHTFKINEAFALGNLDGNHTDLGVACTIKTVEQDTGIYIDHFVVVNFTGFQNMVSALGGVQECNTQPINDPKSHLQLTAGQHLLNPKQALAYVRARYTLGDGSDLQRIGRQQAFMSSLIQRVKSKLLNPVAIYRFLDAATKSLTIDTKLGGATGLYNLASSLRSLPADKVAFFTLPTYPRSEVDPADTANVLWTQPEDGKIFQTFRNDVPASQTLFSKPSASPSGRASAPASGQASGQASGPASGQASAPPSAAVSPSATPDTAPPGAATGSGGVAAGGPASGSASGSASPGASVTPSLSIPSARTANQNICTG